MSAFEAGLPVEQRVQASKSRQAKLLVLLIFLPFLILAIPYLKTLIQLLFVRNDAALPEGAFVYSFLCALQTGKLYSSPFRFPFNEQMYGPVFYLIGVAFAKAAHGDATMTTLLWRGLSFLSFIGSAGLVGYLSWTLERVMRWSAIAIILCLASPCAVPFAGCVRPDELSVFLILSALTVYVAAKGRCRFVFWAGVLASISCLTKQSTAPVVLALLIDGLAARRFRNVAALIAGCAPVPAILLCVLWLRQEPFLANFLAVRHALFDWPFDYLLGFVRHNELDSIPAFLALLGAALSWRKDRYRTILLAAVIGSIANVAAMANTGGYANYLILPWLMMCLLVPPGLTKLEEWSRSKTLIPLGLVLLSGFLLHRQWRFLAAVPSNLDTANLSKLKMLTDQPYLGMRSREPQLLDPYYYHQLALQNLWSAAPIIQQIDGEQYDLLVIRGEDPDAGNGFLVDGFRGTSHWGIDMLDPMMRHYRTLCEVPRFIVLVPLNRSVPAEAKDITRIFGQPCVATNRTLRLEPDMR